MSKFKVGEIVVFVGGEDMSPMARTMVGKECEITHPLGIYYTPWMQYGAKFPGNSQQFWAVEEHLRKRPDDKPFSEWFRNTIITDPIAVPNLETTMRNVARNLQAFTEGLANDS
jgi:hypothetical protein